jgi:hypothetical protein
VPTVQNVSPLGDLDVPLLRRVVKAGEVVDVAVDQAAALLEQPSNWQPARKRAAVTAKNEGAE